MSKSKGRDACQLAGRLDGSMDGAALTSCARARVCVCVRAMWRRKEYPDVDELVVVMVRSPCPAAPSQPSVAHSSADPRRAAAGQEHR
jgi:hypothetical protein